MTYANVENSKLKNIFKGAGKLAGYSALAGGLSAVFCGVAATFAPEAQAFKDAIPFGIGVGACMFGATFGSVFFTAFTTNMAFDYCGVKDKFSKSLVVALGLLGAVSSAQHYPEFKAMIVEANKNSESKNVQQNKIPAALSLPSLKS